MPIAAADIRSDKVTRPRVAPHKGARWLGPEAVALSVIALPLGWLTWSNGGVDPGDQAIVFGWILGCAAVWSVALRQGARIALPWPAVLIMLIPVVQLLPIGNWADTGDLYALFTASGVSPPGQISVYPFATIQRCVVLGGCCALFAVARTLANCSQRAFLVVAVSLLAIGLAESVAGLQQHLASQAVEGPATRFARGTLVNRDHFAALMEGFFGFAVGLALATIARRNWKLWLVGRESTLTAGALLTAGSCGVAVVFSYSRMGIIVLAGMVGAAFVLSVFRNRMGAVFLVLAGVAGTLVASAAGLRGLSARFAELIAQHGDPGRIAAWRDTVRIVPEFAWTGSGLGTFAFVFRRSEPYLPLKGYDHAHSDYLELLLELGVPGALLLFGAVALVFLDTLRKLPGLRDERVRWMAFGCLLGAGGICLHAAADFPLQIPAIAGVAVVLLGLARGLASPPQLHGALARGTTGFVCAGLCVLSVLSLQGRFAALDAEVLSRRAHAAAMQGLLEDADGGYVAALAANPFAAAVWVARAASMEALGEPERALEMLDVARRLEPFALRTEWALANAYLRRERRGEAALHLGLLAASLPEMRATVLDTAWTGGIPAADIASKVIPPDGEAAGGFLNYLAREKTWADLAPAYAALDEKVRQSIPVHLMRYTFDQAFAAGEAEAYLALWEQAVGPVDDHGGPLALTHTGPPETFGLDGYGLQWTVRPHRGVTTRVVDDAESPSIEVHFNEPQNLQYSHLSRDFAVRPSQSYALQTEVRAEGITSSQGIRLLVAAPGRNLAESQPIRRSTDWRTVRLRFRAGAKDRALRLYVVRYPSTTFDRDITGRFRMRNVKVFLN